MYATAPGRLAKAPFVRSLQRLNVSSNLFGSEGLQALLEADPCELHTLQLDETELSQEGVEYLASSPASDTLQELSLAGNSLYDGAARALGKAEHLRNLLVLRLHDNPISTKAGVALEESLLGKRLAFLQLDEDDTPF
jgi:hypothetical protein